MAFEKIDDFTDKLIAEYNSTQSIHYLIALSTYIDTVLSMAKFKGQRTYAHARLMVANPAYYYGRYPLKGKKERKQNGDHS